MPSKSPEVAELIGLIYSPWTEKAVWALEARGVPFTFRHYQPIVGEAELRLKLRRWTGRVTVPLLTDPEGGVHGDSALIARWADTQPGTPVSLFPSGPPTLFPPEHEALIDAAIALSERALPAGRSLALQASLERRDALVEMVPKALRKPLGPFAATVGRVGIHRTLRKYGVRRTEQSEHARELTGALAALRSLLANAPPPADGRVKTLCGRFTFADIAASQALGFVAPPAFGLRIGTASRESFTRSELLGPYADLIAWRDALYEAYRPRRQA